MTTIIYKQDLEINRILLKRVLSLHCAGEEHGHDYKKPQGIESHLIFFCIERNKCTNKSNKTYYIICSYIQNLTYLCYILIILHSNHGCVFTYRRYKTNHPSAQRIQR